MHGPNPTNDMEISCIALSMLGLHFGTHLPTTLLVSSPHGIKWFKAMATALPNQGQIDMRIKSWRAKDTNFLLSEYLFQQPQILPSIKKKHCI